MNGQHGAALQKACHITENAPISLASMDIISKLIEVIRMYLLRYTGHVKMKDLRMDMIISELIEVGGRELVMLNDQNGNIIVHFICKIEKASMDTFHSLNNDERK